MPSSQRLPRAKPQPAPRQCPLCEATVPPGAHKCSFCGSILEPDRPEPTPMPERAVRPDDRLFLFALVVTFAAVVVFWGLVFRMSPLLPRMTVFWVTYLVSGAAAGIAVAVEARRLRIERTPYGTPRWWLALTLLVPPLGIVGYAAARVHAGARDLTRLAMGAAAVWALSAAIVGWSASRGPAPTPPPELREIGEQILRPVALTDTASTNPLERPVFVPGAAPAP
ncbi:MAG: zinc ribbon domain-containing protein [Candidatus Sumerlaea chitinivorans]|uniref:Uncharacterized protein n=1 Tax=Sumerlaea chitinivorans TaxID=2250252 RepID=A0A2Z4Y741_SUMC1|nr:hypothetical protein BRCON_2253 [Candidatus Sumerlaea chitinivorans]MCX7963562.1 zinc ribbon domain-containing protein [Candidatus Sumerlaea chitinivorans]